VTGNPVIGHYPGNATLAGQIGADFLNIPTEVWDAMSPAEQWAANQAWLDEHIAAGHDFILSTPIEQARPGSFFALEIEYLLSQGYTLSADGSTLVAPK
jgi:hypothetical protein